MFRKKLIIVLLLLIVGLGVISGVSASDADDADSQVTAVTSIDDEIADDNLQATADDEVLKDSPTSNDFQLDVDDVTAYVGEDVDVSIDVTPTTSEDYSYTYDFNFLLYDDEGDEVICDNIYGKETYALTKVKTIDSSYLSEGIYLIELRNYVDDALMASSTLNIVKKTSYAVISADDYSSNYNSNDYLTVTLTDQNTGDAIANAELKLEFASDSKTITKYYTTNDNGIVKIVPPVGVGTYTLKISSNEDNIIADPITQSVVISKSTVSIKLAKASAYQGYKITLKATVKNQNGKKINEGKVKFKINGKTYSVAVKNGVATKTLKLSKVKTYKYTATYTGDNFKSKSVTGKAKINKRYATKITVKNQKGYYNKKKTITVKVTTKSGKKVKDGWINVVGTDSYSQVKNGKAKLYVTFSGNYKSGSYNGNSFTFKFKKSVSKTYKLKYVPNSLKYKCSTKKIKITSKFKCPDCGKTKTHNHYIEGIKVTIKVY